MKNKWLAILCSVVMLAPMGMTAEAATAVTEKTASENYVVETVNITDANNATGFEVNGWYKWASGESGSLGGEKLESTTNGATVSYTFIGTKLEIYGQVNPTFGGFEISVDGEVVETVSVNAESDARKQLLYTVSGLSADTTHTVTIKNVTLNGKTKGALDYFMVYNPEVCLEQDITKWDREQGLITYTDEDWSYYAGESGHFKGVNVPEGNNGGKVEARRTGAAITYTFVGNKIEIYGQKHTNVGDFTVRVDEGEPEVVCCHNDSDAKASLIHTIDGLSNGEHTLYITTNGGCEHGYGKSNVWLDYFKVYRSVTKSVTVTSSVGNVSGGGNFAWGEMATLTATEKDGYQFKGWYVADATSETGYSGDALSTDLIYEFVVEEDKELVAVYEAEASAKATLTLTDANNVTVDDVVYTAAVAKELGATVKVAYTGNKDNFLYWKNASGKIVSTKATYTFTLVNNVVLTPVVKSATTGSALVEFVNEYEQVLSVSTWTQGGSDALSTTTPSKLGYTFSGWALETAPTTVVDAAAVRTAITGGATYVRLVPVYAKAAVEHTVTYKNNSEGATNKTATVELGATCTVNANDVAVDGQKFSHWAMGDKVVSYNASYTFLVTGDVTLTAVFTEEETVETASILEITSQYEIKNGETVEKVAFVASREIAEGYTVLEHGMLYARNSEITDPAAFVEGVAGVNKFTASGTGMKGALTLNVRLGEATSIKVRAYAIVMDTEGNVTTLYSDMATYTK